MTAGFGPSSKVRAIFSAAPVCRSVGPYNCEDGATAPQAAIPAADKAPVETTIGQGFNTSPKSIFARHGAVCQPLFQRKGAGLKDEVGARKLHRVRYHGVVNSISLSEATTKNIRVRVQAKYDPSRSSPQQSQWFFLYTVKITNEGRDTVQLISRHWVITDGMEHVEEVRGPGVVGNQPVLKPGQSFEYTSGCPLTTPFGSMHGTYQMINNSDEKFDIEIAPFTLTEPYDTVN